MTNKSYITKVLEITESGDAIIEIPQELIDQLGWSIGDTLDFEIVNGAVIIRNLTKENNERRDDYTPSNG